MGPPARGAWRAGEAARAVGVRLPVRLQLDERGGAWRARGLTGGASGRAAICVHRALRAHRHCTRRNMRLTPCAL